MCTRKSDWDYIKVDKQGWISNVDTLGNDLTNTAYKCKDLGKGYNYVTRSKGVARDILSFGCFEARRRTLDWDDANGFLP